MDPWLQYFPIIIFLIVCSAFFSASETAFSSINEIRIKQYIKSRKNTKSAKRVLDICDKYQDFLSTVLVLNNIVNIVLTLLASLFLQQQFNMPIWLITIVASVIIIILGEIIPKNIASLIPERFALFASYVVRILMLICYPISKAIKGINYIFSRIFKPKEEEVTATEKELMTIVETIEKEGVIEQEESDLIQSAIVFDEKNVDDIMKIHTDVAAIDINSNLEEVIAILQKTKYSRIPVLSGKNCVGIINQKDIFDLLARGITEVNIADYVTPPLYLSKRRSLAYALERMQRTRSHIAIVVNNIVDLKYIGIVTLEDILEELVGEIYDETDKLPKDIVEYGRHTFEVSGDYLVDDLFDYLDETSKPRTVRNIDSWVQLLFKKEHKQIREGAKIEFDNIEIKVLDIEKRKGEITIKKVEVQEKTKLDDE